MKERQLFCFWQPQAININSQFPPVISGDAERLLPEEIEDYTRQNIIGRTERNASLEVASGRKLIVNERICINVNIERLVFKQHGKKNADTVNFTEKTCGHTGASISKIPHTEISESWQGDATKRP